ncbi:PilZ domain-containing protein [Parvularcula marina]|uniref:PilZ domain-containing protein n=1 Tax=Parvularcula marina TaxID=2292771 RepID=UPI003511D040
MGPPLTMNERRREARFKIRSKVSIEVAGVQHGQGELVDISNSGLAFSCMTKLPVGSVCQASIQGIGTYSIRIVRLFNVYNYGAAFELEEHQRPRLKAKIEAYLEQMNSGADIDLGN